LVLNIAHRGARSLAPENTLLAARRGFAAGADLWETDVAATGDGQLILMHDDQLGRTTDVAQCFPGRADWAYTRFRLEEIRRLDAGSWFVAADPFGQIAAGRLSPAEIDECRGQHVPTVAEALALTRALGWRINLELKQLPPPMEAFPMVPRVLAAVEASGIGAAQVLISSFFHPWLHEVRTLRPEIEVQALLGEDWDQTLDWGRREFSTYNLRHDLVSEKLLRDSAAEGLTINLFTVNAVADMRRYAAAGAAGIITDFPQRLAALDLG
jgi:glycerophosphoryl diester phosphodiesterase